MSSFFVYAAEAMYVIRKESEDVGIKSHKDIEGFEQWINEKDAMELAADVYDDTPIGTTLENGWTIIDKKNFEDSGLKAKLYEKNDKYIFATAGTEAGILDGSAKKDWIANFEQQVKGSTKQYEQSMRLAKEYARKYGSSNLVFVGHSLGGGLASANSLVTGCSAITFNSSSLSKEFKKSLTKTFNSKIAAYVADGDILDYVNEVFLRQKVEGVVIRRSVSASQLSNLQGIPGTGAYQLIRGIRAHNYIFDGI